jgi:hypothetical protein
VLLPCLFAGPGTAEGQDPAAPRPWRGLPLTEALVELQARGLDIVFTSQVVRPEMRVVAEPASSEPREVLEEILRPLGLETRPGPGGVLVVVPAAEGAPGAGSVAGVVRSQEFLAPVAEAVIRVAERGLEVRSTANGGFTIEDLPAGAYTLDVRAPGFLARQTGVAVQAGRRTRLEIQLQPVPFVYDEIVVRPSRLSLLRDEPAAPLALSRKEIDALPHLAGDVFRALSLLPGVTSNDVSAQLQLHGGRRDEVQILLDGQELYDAYHLEDFDDALSVVASEELSGLDLSTGAFPASRGDRMSGVLDMTTAPPSGPLSTRLSLSLLTALASNAGTFRGGHGGWLVAARRGSIELAARIFGRQDPAFWDLYGKVELRPDARNLLRAHLLSAGDTFTFQETVAGDFKSADTDYDRAYLWLTHQGVLGRRWVLDTTASVSRFDRDRRGLEDEEEQALEVLDRRRVDVVELRQSWGWQAVAEHSLKWGLEGRRYEAGYDYFNRVESDFVVRAELTEPRRGLVRFEDRLDGEHVAGWVSDRFSPLPPLTAELGLRWDRHTLTDDTLLSPRVNLAWRLGEASVLRGAWGYFHQSQRPYELQVQDGEKEFFRAERSEHWVLGWERLFGQGEGAPLRAVRLEAYRREVGDPRPRYDSLFEPLNTFPEAEPDRVRIAPEHFRAEGLEVVLRGSAGPRVGWWASYALSSAKDRLEGREVPRPTDQTHALSLSLDWRLGPRWRLDAAWRYHTGWPTSPVALREVVDPEDPEGEPELAPVAAPLYGDRLRPYHRLDLRASREWDLRRGRLTLFFDIQNLYDRENAAGFDLTLEDGGEEGDDGQPRLVIAEETWAGVFPSVGVRWEF